MPKPAPGPTSSAKPASDSHPKPGLANELRPGLGTQSANHAMENPRPQGERSAVETEGEPRATLRGYKEPGPEPREQPADSLAHDLERSTGVSGRSSGT